MIAAYHSRLLEDEVKGQKKKRHRSFSNPPAGAGQGQSHPKKDTPKNQYGFPTDEYERPADSEVVHRKYRAWETYLRKHVTLSKSTQLKKLVREGIPARLRGHVWRQFLGSQQLQAKYPPHHYADLLKKVDHLQAKTMEEEYMNKTQNKKETKYFSQTISLREIEKDLRRTFPHHRYVFFDGLNVLLFYLLCTSTSVSFLFFSLLFCFFLSIYMNVCFMCVSA